MKSKNRKITMGGLVTTTFSNRLRPVYDKAAPMQVWCPMCYLETVLRERLGLGFGRGSSKNESKRLYLYLLPDYSFTPEFWTYASEILEPFRDSTRIKLRYDSRHPDDLPPLPQLWLLNKEVDDEWIDTIQRSFTEMAEHLAELSEKSKAPVRELAGEKMKMAAIESAHFLLIPYEISSRDKTFAATDSEIWMKATYSALLIHLLLGVRVYVTDKPYLPLTRPDEMKHIIELDGVHTLLRKVLIRPEQTVRQGDVIALANLEKTLDVLSAIWQVNASLSGGRGNRDKQVAQILEKYSVEPTAGAHFYKRWQTENGYELPPALQVACKLLYDQKLKKGGAKLSLAQKLTTVSLQLFNPNRYPLKGRAHRYETIFRTAIEAIKTSPSGLDSAELKERVAGRLLKRLSRLSGGFVSPDEKSLLNSVGQFADLMVDDLFIQRCRSSKAKLTHEENALADAIYYRTDIEITEKIELSKQKKKNQEPSDD